VSVTAENINISVLPSLKEKKLVSLERARFKNISNPKVEITFSDYKILKLQHGKLQDMKFSQAYNYREF